ncbi:MAG: hypothetical protein ABH885_04490, partial [Candidatus Omnitrophota bacterium]
MRKTIVLAAIMALTVATAPAFAGKGAKCSAPAASKTAGAGQTCQSKGFWQDMSDKICHWDSTKGEAKATSLRGNQVELN